MGLDLGNVPNLEKIAIPRPNAQFPNVDGLQEAHIYGKEFTNTGLKDLLDLIDPSRAQSNVDARSNGFLAPESSACGMATGVAVHRGKQQDANGVAITKATLSQVMVANDNSLDLRFVAA